MLRPGNDTLGQGNVLVLVYFLVSVLRAHILTYFFLCKLMLHELSVSAACLVLLGLRMRGLVCRSNSGKIVLVIKLEVFLLYFIKRGWFVLDKLLLERRVLGNRLVRVVVECRFLLLHF